MPDTTGFHSTLLAIAADLLAQTEAQLRAARRFEQSVQQLTRTSTPAGLPPEALQRIRAEVRSMQDLAEAQRTLLSECERELSGVES